VAPDCWELGVTALVAGFMSGMAGNVTAFTTVWTYDIYKPFIRKDAGGTPTMFRWVGGVRFLECS